jgi:glyceraldehyde-3-phosphate dehydrogenase/erythrose-4-phosphate dehydrogenase
LLVIQERLLLTLTELVWNSTFFIISWYDNEYGYYSSKLIDLSVYIAGLK